MDKNWDSSDSDGETEDKRGINSGHVIVVGTNAAGDLMIHLTMRSSRIPASHAGGAWNHAAGSADRGEHPDVAAAREFLEEYGHELSSMPNEKLADGVFVVHAGRPRFRRRPERHARLRDRAARRPRRRKVVAPRAPVRARPEPFQFH